MFLSKYGAAGDISALKNFRNFAYFALANEQLVHELNVIAAIAGGYRAWERERDVAFYTDLVV